ncbi:hypothetical protein EDD17DRAFT_323138 [Pisolithus thermaeus]|nr:hypothetical protein EDD17DRAFT_323138 [Pisolithus thermaeus]
MSQLLSTAVITATGLTCKAFLHSGLCSITISNLAVLLDALQDQSKRKGQGLITGGLQFAMLSLPNWPLIISRTCSFQSLVYVCEDYSSPAPFTHGFSYQPR